MTTLLGRDMRNELRCLSEFFSMVREDDNVAIVDSSQKDLMAVTALFANSFRASGPRMLSERPETADITLYVFIA